MNRFSQRLLLAAAAVGIFIPGCSFFTGPDEADVFGELQINVRFAGADSSTTTGQANLTQDHSLPAKAAQPTLPQAIDHVVVVILKNPEYRGPDFGQMQEREILRKEIPVGADRVVRAVLQVPLEKEEQHNCFIVRILAFEQRTPLYSGQDIPCFSKEKRQATANILMQPISFRVFPLEDISLSNDRIKNFSVQVQDTALTDIVVEADSILQKLPVQSLTQVPGLFSHPVMLFGDTTLIRIKAFNKDTSRGEILRRVVYTDTAKADVLVALVWDQPVDLDLEIFNPLLPQTLISAATPGDRVDGVGLLRLNDTDGFGPEVYEWREVGRIVRGQFQFQVRRQVVNANASGQLHIFLREGKITQRHRAVPFSFTPQDTGPVKIIDLQQWPPTP
jgi:hypothetical protein